MATSSFENGRGCAGYIYSSFATTLDVVDRFGKGLQSGMKSTWLVDFEICLIENLQLLLGCGGNMSLAPKLTRFGLCNQPLFFYSANSAKDSTVIKRYLKVSVVQVKCKTYRTVA